MIDFRFTLAGEPHPQGRPRARAFGGHVQIYDPPESAKWKRWAAAAFRLELERRRIPMPVFGLDAGPLELHALFVFELPKGEHRKRIPPPRSAHARKPDGSNVLKALEDSANGILWADDSAIARLVVEKVMGAQGEAPRIELHVGRLGWPGVEMLLARRLAPAGVPAATQGENE